MTAKEKSMSLPKVGDDIYIPTELHISRGADDIDGGLATVASVEPEIHGDREVHGIKVEGFPDRRWFWENYLAENQEKWRERYGIERAKAAPDTRPEFNSGAQVTVPDLRRWLEEGKKQGATHVIIMSDTYDYVYYPVLVMPEENSRDVAKRECEGHVLVKEVYSLSLDIEKQLLERKAMHWD